MAGSIPGMILADNGADVVKVERPGGGWDRAADGRRMWDRGKRSIVLDLSDGADRVWAAELAAHADVVISSCRPGVLDAVGLGAGTLRGRHPGLVHCSISGFGPAEGYEDVPAYDAIVAAACGHMVGLDVLSGAVPGQDRAAPIFTAVPLASFAASQLALHGILAALVVRARSGRGDAVHTSLVQGLGAILMRQEMARGAVAPATSATPAMNAGIEMCFMTARCADGRYLQMCARQDQHFRNWLAATGLAHRLSDSRYAQAPLGIERVEDVGALAGELRAAMATRTSGEWMQVFVDADVGADPFLTPDEYLRHPQMVENERVVTIEDPEVGPTRQVGALALFGLSPSTIGRGAPLLDQHRDELAHDPRWSGPAVASEHPVSASVSPNYPLAGLVVIEVAYFLAGPLAATLLGELGARVIKVEPPGGDPGRRTGLQSAKLLHGKESIVIDLKTAEGLALLEELVDGADVFLHSFRPGVAERLGVGAEALLARNPQLIYAYAASYGSKGPQARRAAFHSTPNALVGSGILQAGEGNPPVDDSYPDPGSALGVATAILLALHGRTVTGRGQALETTMLTTAGYVMAPYTTRPETAGAWRLPDTRQLGLSALARLYPCAEGWVYVGGASERDWQAIATTVGHREWIADPRFADQRARRRHDALLQAAVAEALAAEAAATWEQRARPLRAPLVAASPVAKDRWMEDHKLLIEAEHPLFGEYWRPPVRVDFSDARPRLDPASAPGEHTRAILAELGRDRLETDRLVRRGVVQAWEPVH